MDETGYETALGIIAAAGDSKGCSAEAIKAARAGDFEKAEELLLQADEGMRKAHDFQFDMIQQEAAGTHADVNIILVHAQDHLTMAIMAQDLAKEAVLIYRELKKNR